jgi:predicted nuclease of predicted toxin-antitoxin system
LKLLFDENVSWRLVGRLAVLYPDSQHVDLVALKGQTDLGLWEYAARQGFTVVSRDDDFQQLSVVRGQPPKVIWLDVGNAGTDAIADLLTVEHPRVEAFHSNPEEGLLVLELPVEHTA